MRLFVLSVILLLFAGKGLARGIVKISGRIQHPISDSVLVSFSENRIAYYPEEYYARLDSKGNFSLSLSLRRDGYTLADLVHGSKAAELVLQPGDSLVMTADARHFDSTIQYTGRGSEIANVVALHKIIHGRMNQYVMKAKVAINRDPATFLKELATEKQTQMSFLDKHRKGLPATFIKFYNAFYEYYNYFFMQQYPQVHEVITLRRYTDTIPERNYLAVKEMPYAFDDSLLQVPSYLLYLTGVFEIKLRAAGYWFPASDGGNAQKLRDSVSRLALKHLPDKSAEYFIAQDLYGRAKSQEPGRNTLQLNFFKNKWPESEYLAELDKQVSTAQRLAKGQPAPDFDITAPDGRKIRLSDLKGKVVYLTFWASWCKQCVVEMTNVQRPKSLLKNKPVEFVYVSIDRDTAVARAVKEKYKIEGTFTYAPQEWSAPQVRQYGVQGLPAYFLIDRNGKFALQNAPSPPRSTQLLLEINKLLD